MLRHLNLLLSWPLAADIENFEREQKGQKLLIQNRTDPSGYHIGEARALIKAVKDHHMSNQRKFSTLALVFAYKRLILTSLKMSGGKCASEEL